LISVIFVAGAGTAYAGIVLPTITLGGNVVITGDTEPEGKLLDTNDDAGTSGQVLSSTETGIDWIDAPSGTQGATGATGMTGPAGDDAPSGCPEETEQVGIWCIDVENRSPRGWFTATSDCEREGKIITPLEALMLCDTDGTGLSW